MSDETLKALDRALTKLEKGQRRGGGGRFPRSSLTLAIALLLGHQLLVKLVPRVWPSVVNDATWGRLAPWQQATWRLAQLLYGHDSAVFLAVGGVFLAAVVVGYKSKTVRFLIWLAAIAVILLNMAVLFTTYRLSLAAAAGGQL